MYIKRASFDFKWQYILNFIIKIPKTKIYIKHYNNGLYVFETNRKQGHPKMISSVIVRQIRKTKQEKVRIVARLLPVHENNIHPGIGSGSLIKSMSAMRVLGCVRVGVERPFQRRQPGQSTPMEPAAACRSTRSISAESPLTMKRHALAISSRWGESRASCLWASASSKTREKAACVRWRTQHPIFVLIFHPESLFNCCFDVTDETKQLTRF